MGWQRQTTGDDEGEWASFVDSCLARACLAAIALFFCVLNDARRKKGVLGIGPVQQGQGCLEDGLDES